MLFTDVSSERAVRAFKKKGFKIVRKGKHIIMRPLKKSVLEGIFKKQTFS